MTAAPRIARVVAAATAALLLLSGCSLLPNFLPEYEPAEGDPTSKPTGEQVPAELRPYYEQALLWTDCGAGQMCTTAIAPMNWDDPSEGPDIELALTRHAATGAKLGSLFVNPGGPGASGYDLIHDSLDFAVGAALIERFDVIGWDPRGVGRSTAVVCYDDAGMDEFIYGLPAAPRGTQAWIDEVTQASIDFGQACLENTGPVLAYIDTVSTVRDLDMLRAVVGDPKLNYLGYSYGSDIGTFYIELFPEKVGRIVLDGATDSEISVEEVGITQTAGFQRALENYLTACPGLFDTQCPFTGDLDVDLQVIRGLYDRYDATPIAARDGRMMDAGVLDIAMSMALYSQGSWSYLNSLFREAMGGQTDTAFFLADYYYSRGSDGRYLDNSLQAFLAIYCVDYPVETDPAKWVEYEAKLQAASPTTYRPSPPIGDTLCQNWPFQYRGGEVQIDGAGAADVLIIATTGDPATPYEWGVALSEQLESGHLVTYQGEGHTAYNGGVACIDNTIEDYFITGKVPPADPMC